MQCTIGFSLSKAQGGLINITLSLADYTIHTSFISLIYMVIGCVYINPLVTPHCNTMYAYKTAVYFLGRISLIVGEQFIIT